MTKLLPFTETRRDWFLAVIVAVFTAVLLFVPYYLAYTTAGPDTFFTGILMNPEDSQTYFGKMMVGYMDHWLYTIPFTSEPHQPAAVGVFYVWLGQLGRITGLPAATIWHLARLVAQLILFLSIFWFVTQFTRDRKERWTAYLLALTGSGLGWLLFISGQLYWLDAFPVDFKQPGAHIFFTALSYPHIILATTLMLFSVWGLDRLRQRPSLTLSLALGITHLLLGLAYPFLIFLVALVAVLAYGQLLWWQRRVNWPVAWHYAIAFFIPLPLFGYFALVRQQNAVFAAWDAQAVTPSAPWPHYLVAYGPYMLLAAVYWWRRPECRRQTAVLWLWLLAAALLLYAPLNAQRRFVQGVHVPLSILAALGLVDVVLAKLMRTRGWRALLRRPNYTTASLSQFVLFVFLLGMSLSNLYLLASVSLSAVREQPDPLFRPTAEIEAVTWVRDNMPETTVFMAAYQSGNFIAGQTARSVYLGHWAETVNFAEKQAQTAAFYGEEMTPVDRRALLETHGLSHVWHGPREQALGDFDPTAVSWLQPIYANETITIYVVVNR